jgi:uncharacterized protein (TIGR00299 family) protein
MLVGAIIDAGCDPQFLQEQIDKLGIGEVRLVTESVKKQGLRGIKVRFESGAKDQPHRHLAAIEKILRQSSLEADIVEKAVAVFRRIGEAEAWMHDVAIERVHFHEVGAIDAICDIVCAIAGLKRLGIEKLYSSALLVGSGIIDSAHGKIPLPAPATLEIARGFPVQRIDNGREMTTPTGAALIVVLAEFAPGFEMTVDRVGYGAGTVDLEDRPNLLRLVVGTATENLGSDIVAIIETNIDDATPENMGHLQQRLLDSGALDVYVTSILMKKSRPAHKLTAITTPQTAEALAQVILRESSTAGVRWRTESRWKLQHEFRTVATDFGEIKIKFYFGGEIRKFSPEYEDVVAAAIKAGVPFVRVYNAAIAAANLLKEFDRE